MSSPEVFLSVFDIQQGPMPIFSTNKANDSLANKIALKSRITLDVSGGEVFSALDAVLPLPETDKIAYVYIFSIEGTNPEITGKRRIASLNYVVESSEEEQLYGKINLLKMQAEELSREIIKQLFKSSTNDIVFTKDLESEIASFGSISSSYSSLPEYDISRGAKGDPYLKDGSINFLIGSFSKNLEAAIFSALADDTIIVMGQELLVSHVVRGLRLFTLFPPKNHIEYSTTYVDPKNARIIGISRELVHLYDENRVLVIDIDKRTISRENKDKFLKSLLKTLRKSKSETQMLDNIELIVDKIREAVNSLSSIFSLNDESKVKEYLHQYSDTETHLILELSKRYLPKFIPQIEKLQAPDFGDLFA